MVEISQKETDHHAERVKALAIALGLWLNDHAACLGTSARSSTVIAVAFDYYDLAEHIIEKIDYGVEKHGRDF